MGHKRTGGGRGYGLGQVLDIERGLGMTNSAAVRRGNNAGQDTCLKLFKVGERHLIINRSSYVVFNYVTLTTFSSKKSLSIDSLNSKTRIAKLTNRSFGIDLLKRVLN